jgi:hypothetical protein
MTERIESHGARRRVVLCAALFLEICVLGSCGGHNRFELTLRTREFGGDTLRGLTWTGPDGRRAISSSQVALGQHDSDFGDVVCGGETWHRTFFVELTRLEPANSFELVTDNGSHLTMIPQTFTVVGLGETLCTEETGIWRGADGELEGRTGTFSIHYDTIQATLSLVED